MPQLLSAFRKHSRGAVKFFPAVAFLAVIALPFLMRPHRQQRSAQNGLQNLPSRKLVIISPHWEGIRTEFGRAFSEWTARNEGFSTEVEWLDLGGTSDALRYVRNEFERSPRGIDIDLFFGGGIAPYLLLSGANLLSRCDVPDDVLSAIPPTIAGIPVYDAGHRWFGAALAGFGIIYNKKVLQLMGLPEPQTWEDLASPRYFTWVGSGDPRSSGSMHMAYEIILQAYGWDRGWSVVARIGANVRSFSRSAAQVPKDTAVGEVACGMAIDAYAGRQVAQVGEDLMGFRLPQGLTVVNPDAIAILKGAPHRELAGLFIRFVLSEEGQRLWVLKPGVEGGPQTFVLGRSSVIPGLPRRYGQRAAVHFEPYSYRGEFVFDSEKSNRRWRALNDLLGAVIIDAHDDLASAWRALNRRPLDDPLLRELLEPPVSEQELLRLARDRWDHAEFRARTITQWAMEARARYRRLAGGG